MENIYLFSEIDSYRKFFHIRHFILHIHAVSNLLYGLSSLKSKLLRSSQKQIIA